MLLHSELLSQELRKSANILKFPFFHFCSVVHVDVSLVDKVATVYTHRTNRFALYINQFTEWLNNAQFCLCRYNPNRKSGHFFAFTNVEDERLNTLCWRSR